MTNPRNYPDTLQSAQSGRPMVRGEKQVVFTEQGRQFAYMQTGWWCSLSDPLDMEGQLVDEDNLIAKQARRTARAQLASSTADAAISEMASDAHAGGIMDDATYAQITTRRRYRGAAIDPEPKPK